MDGVGSMNNISYDNDNIKLKENTLYFYGKRLNYSVLESASVIDVPRRSLFIGLKEWLYGLLILIVICIFWPNLTLIGDIYIYSIIILMLYNIIRFLKKYYRIVVRTRSGMEYYADGRDKYVLDEIALEINLRIEASLKKEDVIINNGIINKGNNNINVNNVTNYNKITEELIILSSHVEDKETIDKAINYAKNKDDKKLRSTLKKMGKEILNISKDLGLTILGKYLESIFFD